MNQLQHALQSPPAWTACTQDRKPYPEADRTLVFVGDTEKEMVQAATHAAKHGFARTATIEGGAQALETTPTQQACHSSYCICTLAFGVIVLCECMSKLLQAEKKFINRDAVAALLNHVDVGCPAQQAIVLDIRRHDERALYGSIPGATESMLSFLLVPEAQLVDARFMMYVWYTTRCRMTVQCTAGSYVLHGFKTNLWILPVHVRLCVLVYRHCASAGASATSCIADVPGKLGGGLSFCSAVE